LVPGEALWLGWGPPQTWQGWVFMLVWCLILLPVSLWLSLHNKVVLFIVFLIAMVTALILIGYIKGQPPRWRWGGK
jgi:hypothetical protein